LVGNYLLVGLSSMNPDLKPIFELTPMYFFQGGMAIEGLDWAALLGLLGFALLFALLAWWRFQRREIRVGGEGGWSLPGLLSLGRKG
jgi:ABC-2 type transport system permease protein